VSLQAAAPSAASGLTPRGCGRHAPHAPLQAPSSLLERVASITDSKSRKTYVAQVAALDDAIGGIVDSLQQHGLYNDTLVWFSSDNGGPSFAGGPLSSNNFPLRGSKLSDLEGGIRLAAFVGGGFFERSSRRTAGERLLGLAHLADVSATLVAVSSAPSTDASLPPSDSQNLWPWLVGETNDSPRHSLQISQTTLLEAQNGSLFKMLLGDVPYACWSGPRFPNASSKPGCSATLDCGRSGCLYNLTADEQERHRLESSEPQIAEAMRAELERANASVFRPNRCVAWRHASSSSQYNRVDRGSPDGRACAAVAKNLFTVVSVQPLPLNCVFFRTPQRSGCTESVASVQAR